MKCEIGKPIIQMYYVLNFDFEKCNKRKLGKFKNYCHYVLSVVF